MNNDLTDFFENNVEFKTAKSKSKHFQKLKRQLPPPLKIDEEELFFMYGDSGQVNEDELYQQALIIGSQEDAPNNIYKAIYDELSPRLKENFQNKIDLMRKEGDKM